MADSELLRELNRDVWHPLQKAFGAFDAEAFLALHGDGFIRAGGPTMQVLGLPEYAEQTRRAFADMADRGDRVGIEFRFLERLAGGDLASERGIFRITATRAGDQRVFHGKFHTFARRSDGRWRLAVDYDSDEGGTIDAESFEAATEVDDVSAFAG
jgi:ketosteroid isomerase-like protein